MTVTQWSTSEYLNDAWASRELVGWLYTTMQTLGVITVLIVLIMRNMHCIAIAVCNGRIELSHDTHFRHY